MVPTIRVGDRIRVLPLKRPPARGDIVVFRRPSDDPGGPGDPTQLIKRIIGLPGETISFADGNVDIDDVPLKEGYLPRGTATRGADGLEPIAIPDNEVFVLGDNRGISQDSRYFGPVPESDIVGRATEIISPPGHAGAL
jgi:signal peptidase I